MDEELINRIDTVFADTQMAIGKIKIERKRGAGYFHAEVGWLLEKEDEIKNIRSVLRDIRF